MNRLKAYFVTLLVAVSAVIALLSLYSLISGGVTVSWLGALISVLPFVGFFAWALWFNRRAMQTSQRLPVLSAVAIAGVLLAGYGAFWQPDGSAIAFVAALVAAGGFLLYANWYSFFGRRVNPLLRRGQPLPTLTFEDVDGATVSTESLLGKPALLLFYRGNWCPICTAQVAEVASRYRELIDRGVTVVMISPQPHDLTRRVAGLYEINVNFWVDVEGKAAKVLGVYHEDGVPLNARGTYGADTVLPTAIITDPQGRIIFADQTENYRIRPNPDIFLEALTSHGY